MISNSSTRLDSIVSIKVKGRQIPFSLDWEKKKWRCSEEQKESDFPLTTMVDNKQILLYSDATFAAVD